MKKLLIMMILLVSAKAFSKVVIVDMLSRLEDYSSVSHSDSELCNGKIESVELLKKIPFKSRYKNRPGVFVKLTNNDEPWVCSGILFTSPHIKEGLRLKKHVDKYLRVEKVVKSATKSINNYNLAAVTKYITE